MYNKHWGIKIIVYNYVQLFPIVDISWLVDLKKMYDLLKFNCLKILPPVRMKVKKTSINSAKNVKPSEEKPKKRIASYDYSAWDKLDVVSFHSVIIIYRLINSILC